MAKVQLTIGVVAEYKLYDLAEAYNAKNHMAYRNLLKELKISNTLRSRLTGPRKETRFAEKVNNKKEETEIVKKYLRIYREDIEDSQKACDEMDQEIQELEKRCKELREKRRNKGQHMAAAKRKLEYWEQLLAYQIKELEDLCKYTLIHPTATVTALEKRKNTAILCTKMDANRMKYRLFADQIVDTSEVPLEESDIPYNARQKFATEAEYESAVEYVKMVTQFYLCNKPYELLYNSEGIQYMLNSLGLL